MLLNLLLVGQAQRSHPHQSQTAYGAAMDTYEADAAGPSGGLSLEDSCCALLLCFASFPLYPVDKSKIVCV